MIAFEVDDEVLVGTSYLNVENQVAGPMMPTKGLSVSALPNIIAKQIS